MKNQIEKNGFIENQDFASFDNIIKREKGATIKVNLMKILIFSHSTKLLSEKSERQKKYFVLRKTVIFVFFIFYLYLIKN